MKISGYKITWFLVGLILSGLICRYAYIHPEKFSPLVDLIAVHVSMMSILSLAILISLRTKLNIKVSIFASDEERKRVEKIINKDNRTIVDGQMKMFLFNLAALLLMAMFKILTVSAESHLYEDAIVKAVASSFAFFASMALLWSATLPCLLMGIIRQQKAFGIK